MIISDPLDDRREFDAELVEAVIVKMLSGKTAGLWSYSGASTTQPSSALMCFSQIVQPYDKKWVTFPFDNSYTVLNVTPALRPKSGCNIQLMTFVEYQSVRAIKVLKHCILDRYTVVILLPVTISLALKTFWL